MNHPAYFLAVVGSVAAILYAATRQRSESSSDEEAQIDLQEPAPDEEGAPVAQEQTEDTVTETIKNAASDFVAMFGTKYDSLIQMSAEQAGIDPQLLYRLLKQESHFRDDIISGRVTSSTGALGIAQFMPPTAREVLGSVEAALDPRQAIPGAARYLRSLANQLGGDMKKAVAAYNWGVGNVLRKGLAAAPSETRQYVAAVYGEPIA